MGNHNREFRALLFLALAGGCSAAPPAQVHVEDRRVHLVGRIDHSMAEQFSAIDLAQLDEIVVDSAGGKVDAAIEIAEKITASGKALRIKGRCMSACASILLPSARQARVEQGALIALHGTQTGLAKLFQRTQEREHHGIAQSRKVVVLAQHELALYRDAGIDPRLLLLPYTARGTLCYANVKQPDGTWAFAIASKQAALIVDAQTLAAFGVNITQEGSTSTNPVEPSQRPMFTPMEVDQAFDELVVHRCA